ncbi:MAG: hypothetical protein WCT04_01400 [Planctomycetota bacterium]
MSDETKSTGDESGTNGKIVVIVMLIMGLIGGLLLSRNMPYSNPAETDEGSPYYSRPNDEQIKILKDKHMKNVK